MVAPMLASEQLCHLGESRYVLLPQCCPSQPQVRGHSPRREGSTQGAGRSVALMTTKLLVLIAATLTPVSLVGCGGQGKGRVAPLKVTAAGRVGSLRIRRSTRADVIAFAGRPQSEAH